MRMENEKIEAYSTAGALIQLALMAMEGAAMTLCFNVYDESTGMTKTINKRKYDKAVDAVECFRDDCIKRMFKNEKDTDIEPLNNPMYTTISSLTGVGEYINLHTATALEEERTTCVHYDFVLACKIIEVLGTSLKKARDSMDMEQILEDIKCILEKDKEESEETI